MSQTRCRGLCGDGPHLSAADPRADVVWSLWRVRPREVVVPGRGHADVRHCSRSGDPELGSDPLRWVVSTRPPPRAPLPPCAPTPCASQMAASPAPGPELCGFLPLEVMGSVPRFEDSTVNNPAVLNKGAAWSVTVVLKVVTRHEREWSHHVSFPLRENMPPRMCVCHVHECMHASWTHVHVHVVCTCHVYTRMSCARVSHTHVCCVHMRAHVLCICMDVHVCSRRGALAVLGLNVRCPPSGPVTRFQGWFPAGSRWFSHLRCS